MKGQSKTMVSHPEMTFTSIGELISEGAEETLHREFKTLADSTGERLTKDDRRLLAKAICGMANAEGGTIIVGVETKRTDNVDVAVAAKPIANAEKMRNLVTAAIPEMLSPQNTGIRVVASAQDGAGFIVIEVPRSDDRPHHSNVHHQYFRRGSDGTRVLEHGEIRELMFAVQQGNLEVRFSVQSQISSGNRIGFGFLLSLGNVGRVPVRAPYLKVSPAGWDPPRSAVLDVRLFRGNTLGFYGKTDHLVHVEDEFHMAVRLTGIEFLVLGPPNHKDRISTIRQAKDPDLFYIKRFDDNRPVDQLFGPFRVTYGAENAPPKTAKFDLSKWDMFEIIAQSFLNEI
jgi:hypothetical protein